MTKTISDKRKKVEEEQGDEENDQIKRPQKFI